MHWVAELEIKPVCSKYPESDNLVPGIILLWFAGISEIALYARVDNSAYRLLKAYTPGAYTFILRATSEVPRLLMHPKRKTIGIRIPDHPVVEALVRS